jgi:hypothetical protein
MDAVDQIEKQLERGAVLLVPDGPMRPTEYGKRWMEKTWEAIARFDRTIRDVAALDAFERPRWAMMQRELELSGVPTNITSGVSQYGMQHLIDHLNGKTPFTMPATVAMGLWTVAPTSTSTGALAGEAAYTGYARQTLVGTVFGAASPATPSVSLNASTITFGNCTGSTSTLLGFELCDSATVAAGNALWYGTLPSTVISTTQTPPTIATGSLSTSMTGT